MSMEHAPGKQNGGGSKQPIEFVKVRVTPDGRVSLADGAAYLGLSTEAVRTWVKTDRLRSVKVGGRRFLWFADLQQIIAQGAAA